MTAKLSVDSNQTFKAEYQTNTFFLYAPVVREQHPDLKKCGISKVQVLSMKVWISIYRNISNTGSHLKIL